MHDLIDDLTNLLISKKMSITTAESCTGGLLAAALTHKEGSSRIFDRGFVTYSNESKTDMLGVPKQMIDLNGAVSAQVAESMARGALKNSKASLAVSITGIAGPDGGTEAKPVGLVYFGYALKGGSAGSLEHHFEGSRREIQSAATTMAIKHLISVLRSDAP